jgi:hypothetical protein
MLNLSRFFPAAGPYHFTFFLHLCLLSTLPQTALAESVKQTIPSSHCPPYTDSSYYRTPGNTKTADPSNWIQTIQEATDGDEILLEDGTYSYDGYAVVFNKPVTIRGKSGRAQDVVIQGHGYGEPSEALMIMADDVHIADLTVKDVHDHAISFKENFARSVIYNVELYDIGTQHIKGSHMGPEGVIACSNIGYQNPTGTGDYNSGIDLHGAVAWTIRDNNFYNIFGDGSGCVVDRDCGTQYPGGGSAILVWNNSRDNTIERNRITESFRGISLGLSTPYSGGVVRNNLITRSTTGKEGVNGFIEADTGISMIGAVDVLIEGNTVVLAGDYQGPIEVQDATGIVVVNNLMSKPVWNRGNADYNGCTSQDPAECNDAAFGNIVLESDTEQLADAANDSSSVATTDETDAGEMQTAAPAENESMPLITADNTETTDQPAIAPHAADDATELLAKIDTAMAQLKHERMLATAERLKMMEERLRYKEAQLEQREREIAQREKNLQQTLQTIQQVLDQTRPAQ